jgi:hypothetical protein
MSTMLQIQHSCSLIPHSPQPQFNTRQQFLEEFLFSGEHMAKFEDELAQAIQLPGVDGITLQNPRHSAQ